jgi:hypothetical protein
MKSCPIVETSVNNWWIKLMRFLIYMENFVYVCKKKNEYGLY